MSTNVNSIVVSYGVHENAFHRESLLEFTQGNALNILKNRPASYQAIAVVETNDEGDRAIADFLRQLQVARGLEDPIMVNPESTTFETALSV